MSDGYDIPIGPTLEAGRRLAVALQRIGFRPRCEVDLTTVEGLNVRIGREEADDLTKMVEWWAEFTPTQRQQILDGRRMLNNITPRPVDRDYDPRIDAAENRARRWD